MAATSTVLSSSVWNLDSSSSEIRDLLIHFWLSAPIDQLETLWSLPFGSKSMELVRSLNSNHEFTDQQVALRNTIASRLSDVGLSDQSAPQLMLANFLLSPPGLLTINNIDMYFPRWLAVAYTELYEKSVLDVATPLSAPAAPSNPDLLESPPISPDFGPFPTSLVDLISNRIHLNRILGLSNLYYIDPDDDDIRSELLQLRLSLASAIDNSPESDLQSYFSTEFADRYWSLIRSGIQKESLTLEDQTIKQNVIHRLNPSENGGFGTPRALNAFLIAMMYFLPGTMNVPDADNKLPSWILPFYKEIFIN
jgi:hypothetical protein